MLPFRLGATSYIIPDDILPNVRYLAGKVQDIELVLFEVDDGPNNLPSSTAVAELAALAEAHRLTYTIHLPLDLRLGEGGDEGHASLVKARKVIECTAPLHPWAYVLHLEGKSVLDRPSPVALRSWQAQAVRALQIVAGWAGDPRLLAVENLDGYPPDFNRPVLQRFPASHCVDIGHLWKDGIDPVPYLEASLPRTRVIHIHGIGSRDHQSLALIPPAMVKVVLDLLLHLDYRGVMTLEVFNEEDFQSSLRVLREASGAGERNGG